jgi:23S rRNA (guanine745-N1)-methyltransferase
LTDARHTALDAVLPALRCPVCEAPLARVDAALRCESGHSFDIARQGYASLLTGARPTSGDDGPMVAARGRLLGSGLYAPILADLVSLVADSPGTVIDAGCGTGYYLGGVLDALPESRGLGLDSSTHALRIAAKAHPRAAAVACDLFGPLPISSGCADLVLTVFSPRNPAEFRRILRPDGALVVTRPTDAHLSQLRREVEDMIGIDPAKEPRLEAALDPLFKPERTFRTEYTAPIAPEQAADLIFMSPSARHLGRDELGDLPGEVDVSVLTTVYRVG